MDQPDDALSPADLSAAEFDLLRDVIRSLRGLRYGTLVLSVHEGHVVEIHRTEKTRRRVSRTKTEDADLH